MPDHGLDHGRVVRRDAGIRVSVEQQGCELHEGPIDLGALRPCDLGWLGIGALADAGAHPSAGESLDVRPGPMQVGLDHRPDVAAGGPEALHDLERRCGARRALHVDADEDAVPGAGLDDRSQDAEAGLDPQAEAHLRQLQADVRVEALGGDAFDRAHVVGRGTLGRCAVGDALAEHVEGRRHPRGIERRDHGDRLVERRPGHEPQRDPAQQRNPERQPRQPATLGEPEQQAAQQRGDHRAPWLQPRARSIAARMRRREGRPLDGSRCSSPS